jgi:hypothetical protein
LTLREASYPPVQYIPRRDVDMAALMRSEHTTYCPYKGDASYYSIPAGGIVPSMRCGLMRPHSKRWRRSRIMSPATRTVSTRSANRRRRPGFGDNAAQRDGKILDEHVITICHLRGGKIFRSETLLSDYAERFLRLSGRQMDPPQGRVWSVYRRRMK